MNHFSADLFSELLQHELINPTDLVSRLPKIFIQGMEVTQAIQYYRSASHLTDPTDQGADNSVTLVAGKPAWVRVYVRSWIFGGAVSGVTGTLEVYKRNFGFLFSKVSTLTPQPPGSVTALPNPDYVTERSTLSETLNFIIPADQMCGNLNLRAKINTPGGLSAEYTLNVDVTLKQSVHIRAIMVGYNGPSSSAPGAPNLTLAAPTLANLQTTAAWTLLTFPVSSTAAYSSAGTITWNLPLTDAPSCPGCCSPNWVALNTAVQAQRTADGNRTDVLYYGLMANGIPMGPIIGCNTGTVSTGANGNAVTMAHELGHACGLPHAPCGTPGDPNYPAYEPYDPAATPQASIGEYGLDISNGNIQAPNLFKDIMSYCGPRWISLYNYGRLTNNANLNPIRTCVDYPWWRDVVVQEPIIFPEKWLPDPPPDPPWRERFMKRLPVISIIAVVHADDEIEINSIMRVSAEPEIRGGKETGMMAELIGKREKILARAPLYRMPSQADGGCGCEDDEAHYPYLVQAYVPDVEPGQELRIRRAKEELWSQRAPKEEPVIEEFSAKVSKKGDELTASWRFQEEGKGKGEFWLQYSDDKGETWHALATLLRGKRAQVDISSIAGGEILVRLLASDGFHTSVSEPLVVDIPERSPAVSIYTPRDGQTLVAGQPMRLWGAVTSGRIEREEQLAVSARWLLDGQEVAEELDAFIEAPKAGEHKLSLVASIGGQEGEVSIGFVTVGRPDEGDYYQS